MKVVWYCLLLLLAGLMAVEAGRGCPYNFTVATRLIPRSCYQNNTNPITEIKVCCWYAYASYIFAVSEHANRTGTVFLDAQGSNRCTDEFVSYVKSRELVPSTFFLNATSTCAIDPLTFTANGGPCGYATMDQIWRAVNLSNAATACNGPNLNWSEACMNCERVIANAIDLLKITEFNEFVPCGMAVVVGLWGKNPSEDAFDPFVGCITQVLQNIGKLDSNLIPYPLPLPSANVTTSKNGGGRRVAVSAGIAAAGALAVVTLGWILVLKLKKLRNPDDSRWQQALTGGGGGGGGGEGKNNSPPLPTEGLYIFTRRELRQATGGFDPGLVLGQGGSSKVYLRKLPSGKTVAVKRIVKAQKLAQFYQEVRLLSRLRHPNLTALLGYCLHRRDHILVYEYMPGGDLGDLLYRNPSGHVLPWDRRLRIALDCAEGLAYLHLFPEGAIIHRDIKPTNILLDDSGQAKLADLGVSKFIAVDFTPVSTEIKGTTGYLDPEYFSVGQLTEASDVYSFGVVLLELVSGQRAVITTPSGGAESIVHVTDVLMSGDDADATKLVEPRISDDVDRHMESFKMVVEIACGCVRPYRFDRPSTLEVLTVLREAWRKTASIVATDHNNNIF